MGLKKIEKYVYDHDYLGTIQEDGAIKQVWGEEALNQSLKHWLASFKADLVRSPNRGGYLTPLLAKPMNTLSSDSLKMAIRDGLYQDYQPFLAIEKLEVEPNYEGKYWYIYLEVYSVDLKTHVVVEEKIKAKV